MLVSTAAYKWVMFNCALSGSWPMISIGRDTDGNNLVVGRFQHAGDMLPAKVKPASCNAWASYNGGEYRTKDFEVMVRYTYEWVQARNGEVPYNAVPGGQTASGETLYIGRTWYNGATLGGKVQRSQGRMYAPYNGAELQFTDYEVLVQT